VRQALSGDRPPRVPAAAVHGVDRTRWLLDRQAAGQQ
jgi:6-phosphogluconolactonase